MRTVSYRLGDLARATINIGKVAENEYTRVQFNAADILAEYPAATAALSVINPAGTAYPAVVTREGDLIIWDVTDADLTAAGMGELQLTLTENGVVIKSYIARTRIERSIVASGSTPDPVQNWLDEAAEVLEEVQDAIPAGGTQGQVMGKLSDDDYDIGWIDQTGGGGGGGTSNYNELSNKPQIAGTTLTGNKSLEQLGIASADAVSAKYTKPSSGIPASDLSSAVQTSMGKADSAYQKPGTGIPASDMASAVQTSLGKADTAYQLPSGGVPSSDMASAVQTSLGKADSAYQKPGSGIPASDMASGVQTSLGKADSAYQKPQNGIPASDLASGVIPVLTDLIDDTAGDGDTNKVWSADKSAEEVSTLSSAITELEGEVEGITSDIQGYVEGWLDDHPEATTTVQDGSITKAKLSSGLAEEFKPVLGYAPTYTQTSGKYVGNNGSVVTSQYYGLTSPIAISKGDIVLLEGKGYSASVAMISLTDENATSYTPVVLSYDSNVHTFTYVAKADGYYACSYNIYSATHTIIQYSKDSIQGVANRFNPIENLNVPGFCADAGYSVLTDNASANMSDAGHYIQVDGSYQASGAFKLSSSISIPASSTIQFTAKGYSTNVAVLAKVVNGVYTPLIASTDSNVHTWTYSTTDPVNVVISSNKDTQPIYSVYTSRIDTIDRRLTNMEDDVFAFATMGVIGDSLASGASNHSSGVEDRPVYSWGKYIERVYGVEVSLFTNGGFTTRDWLTEVKGLAALNAADPLDCYVIGLGQNDAFSLGDAYLGSSSDVHVGSEAQNADTYYGNYSKIIAAIKAKSPRAKIFCLTNALPTSNTKLNYNTAVRTIVPLYTETYLVDLAADAFYTSELFKGFWNGAHSTACGYKLVAKNIHDNICDVIRANISEFKDIQWIVENHS